MDITAQLAQDRGIPPDTAAWINRFPDDPDSVADANRLHTSRSASTAPGRPWGWHWINQGADWTYIAYALGLNATAHVDDLTEQLQRQADSIKRQAAVIDTQAAEISRLRAENEELRKRAARRGR